jgi:hypothetical protein
MTIIGSGVSFSNDPCSLLDIVVKFCERTDLAVPTQVMGSTDGRLVQIRSLLEEEGHDLARRGPWEGLVFEATHTSLAAESQGAMGDLASNNFSYIKDSTIWDRTNRLPIWGPMTDREWQARKAMVSTGPRYRYRIRGGQLLVTPTPAAGATWAFEYVTKNWILNDLGEGREYFLVDEDVTVLPCDLLILGLRWRWKKEKGREYAEDFATYEQTVMNALGRDGSKPIVRMDGAYEHDAKPAVLVPLYSWNQP